MADHDVILKGNERIGQLWVARTTNEIRLIDITLAPAARGIGSGLLKDLVAEGHAGNVPVRLSVMQGNAAQHLYERLGFCITCSDGVYLEMEKAPGQA